MYIYIYSDILPGIFADILTSDLTFILTHNLTHVIWHAFRHLFWHNLWQCTWHYVWPCYPTSFLAFDLAVYLTYIRTFYLGFYLWQGPESWRARNRVHVCVCQCVFVGCCVRDFLLKSRSPHLPGGEKKQESAMCPTKFIGLLAIPICYGISWFF